MAESSISVSTSGCASSALISDAKTSRCRITIDDTTASCRRDRARASDCSVRVSQIANANMPSRSSMARSPCSSKRCTITSESPFAAELMPARDETVADLAVVVDLAVEDQLDRSVFVGDRLIGSRTQIDDAQAAEAQPGAQAAIRGRSRRDRGRGVRSLPSSRASASSSTGRAVEAQLTANAAHRS